MTLWQQVKDGEHIDEDVHAQALAGGLIQLAEEDERNRILNIIRNHCDSLELRKKTETDPKHHDCLTHAIDELDAVVMLIHMGHTSPERVEAYEQAYSGSFGAITSR